MTDIIVFCCWLDSLFLVFVQTVELKLFLRQATIVPSKNAIGYSADSPHETALLPIGAMGP